MINMTTCACGCGSTIEWKPHHKRTGTPKYLRGHHMQGTGKIDRLGGSPNTICQCGCGEAIDLQPHHKYRGAPKFKHGHNVRGLTFTRSDEAKRNISEASQKAWASKSEDERKAKGQALAASLSPEVRARQGISMKKARTGLTPEKRAEWKQNQSTGIRKAWRDGKMDSSGTKTWYHVLPSGREFLVQSSWEAHLADLLDQWGVTFTRGPRLQLIEHSWRPDFLINDDLIIEVKGHPLAVKQFDAAQRPEIPSAALPYSVAVLKIDAAKPEVTSLHDLLTHVEWLKIEPRRTAYLKSQFESKTASSDGRAVTCTQGV